TAIIGDTLIQPGGNWLRITYDAMKQTMGLLVYHARFEVVAFRVFRNGFSFWIGSAEHQYPVRRTGPNPSAHFVSKANASEFLKVRRILEDKHGYLIDLHAEKLRIDLECLRQEFANPLCPLGVFVKVNAEHDSFAVANFNYMLRRHGFHSLDLLDNFR